MRWIGTPGDSDQAVALRRTAFSRPVRWLLALHGDHVVPFEFAGLRAGRTTRSMRFQEPEIISISRAADYPALLAAQGIVIDPSERRKRILDQAQALASGIGGVFEADPALADEVANMVEAPRALIGAFDRSFLSLPDEVLTALMKKHQRYFPVRDRNGRLLSNFIVVGNGGDDGQETIRAGNEHVLKARFADAEFFLRKDRQKNSEYFRSKTALLTFHARLGSMLDKTDRIERLTPLIGKMVMQLDPETAAVAVRAASLCKADLATAMVAEMTTLQGAIGRIYAQAWGEPEAVAQAIFEHYLPRFAGDTMPDSAAGAAVGIADRIDTLAGLFAAGAQPTGTRDPFGLRRTAIGLIQILVARGLRLDLGEWLGQAGAQLPIEFSEEAAEACLRFVTARQEALLLAEGHRHDVVDAVLQAQARDPAGAALAADELELAVESPDWSPVLQAYARCARIVRGQKVDGRLDPSLIVMDAERKLLAGIEELRRPVASAADLVGSLQALVPPITEFFDMVLVMDEDKALRANRLALVKHVVDLADGIADLSRLEGF